MVSVLQFYSKINALSDLNYIGFLFIVNSNIRHQTGRWKINAMQYTSLFQHPHFQYNTSFTNLELTWWIQEADCLSFHHATQSAFLTYEVKTLTLC